MDSKYPENPNLYENANNGSVPNPVPDQSITNQSIPQSPPPPLNNPGQPVPQFVPQSMVSPGQPIPQYQYVSPPLVNPGQPVYQPYGMAMQPVIYPAVTPSSPGVLPNYQETINSSSPPPPIDEKKPLDTNQGQSSSGNPDIQVDIVTHIPEGHVPYTLPTNKDEKINVPRHPVKVVCPHCHQTVKTKIQFENNDLTIGLCIILCCFTCILWILPICLNNLKDCVHYCPNCGMEIIRNKQ